MKLFYQGYLLFLNEQLHVEGPLIIKLQASNILGTSSNSELFISLSFSGPRELNTDF